MPRWTHVIFCAIWLGTAIVFATLAVDSYGATKTELARFSVHFPMTGQAFLMGVDIPSTMTAMADTNNANVAALEKSIRDSAQLTFRLNVFSAVMAIMGLVAQIRVYRQDARHSGERESAVQGDG